MPLATAEAARLLGPEPVLGAALARSRELSPEAIIAEVRSSGLRGRGGAGFPAAAKLELTAQAGVAAYLVVNGAEDEPGSGKDQHLLARRPERVIEGALIAARGAGASHVVFYLTADAIEPLADALARAELKLLDQTPARLEPGGDRITASVVPAPPEYVAGEDTAALEAIEGRPGIPRSRPPFPSESGLWGAPTAVFNVETLAALPAIVLNRGCTTLLATLGPELRNPGVHEVEVATTLRELVQEIGGGLRSGEAIEAVLPGGPSSGFLRADELDVTLEREALAAAGSGLGCAVVRVYGEGECIACALYEQLSFLADSCCGACPPCRMETAMLVRLLAQIRAGGPAALIGKLPEVVAFAGGQGGRCSLIGMPSLPVSSALQRFAEQFAHHAEFGRCMGTHDREDRDVGSPAAQAQIRV